MAANRVFFLRKVSAFGTLRLLCSTLNYTLNICCRRVPEVGDLRRHEFCLNQQRLFNKAERHRVLAYSLIQRV